MIGQINFIFMRYTHLLFILLNSFAINLQAQLTQPYLQIHKLKASPKNEYKFTTYSGAGYGHLDGTGEIARLQAPEGIAVDKNGTLYVTEYGSSIVRKITPDGMISKLYPLNQPLHFLFNSAA